MQDVFFLLIAIAFFALIWWLVTFAARLEKGEKGSGKS